ncbi:hypothetical protein JAAARDRAFT_618077 [Jaapia argillacea MUCL 33604]|uniref:Protein kinase domain-containing protein n=1 Tax=Jaapia argillacea MUCL 33604 TaxID=933084 RepID=A0A067P4G9_9AGAM|nr:hypothetical protein JAAARDRAFT_618077 [Jaapia argillacea MUCL 33604]
MGIAIIGGKPAIVMRSYKNIDAMQHINLYPHSTVDLILSVVEAVKYLHTRHPQLAHGGLEPSNIVVDNNDRAIISSLASAHIPGSTEYTYTVGQIGAFCRWLAPELIAVDENEDARPPAPTFESDVWALACVVGQLITGKVPYPFRHYTFQVFSLVAKGVLPYTKASIVDAVNVGGILRGEEVWLVLKRCWEKNPTDRPTVTQFETSLRGCFIEGQS